MTCSRVGIGLDTVVTAEAARAYKPRPEPYVLALERLEVSPSRALFVADSPADIAGAHAVGTNVYWHNRRSLPRGEAPPPLSEHASLEHLPALAS